MSDQDPTTSDFLAASAAEVPKKLSTWGVLTIHIEKEDGVFQLGVSLETKCAALENLLAENAEFIEQRSYELLAENRLEKVQYMDAAKAYMEAFREIGLHFQLKERLGFILENMSEAGRKKYLDRKKFTRDFGIPDERLMTIEVLYKGSLQAGQLDFCDPDYLLQSLFTVTNETHFPHTLTRQ